MESATGCYSEHTAEYALIPRIVTILHGAFGYVIPFYFWANREGANLSVLNAPSSTVRLLAVYPRRPKMEAPSEGNLLVKLNAELYDYAAVAEPSGIPVIAGLPLARSLFELGIQPECLWFAITDSDQPPCDVLMWLDETGRILTPSSTEAGAAELLSDESIREMVLGRARPMHWSDAVRAIRESRTSSNRWRYPFWGSNRKPFYVACFDS